MGSPRAEYSGRCWRIEMVLPLSRPNSAEEFAMRTRLARWSWFLSLALFLGMAMPTVSFGQDATATAAAPAARVNPPRVTEVRSNDPKHPGRAGLGDAVILTVNGLGAYLNGDQDACGDLILFLSEVPIPGHPPEAPGRSASNWTARPTRIRPGMCSWPSP
jgi:hypothetical protein